MTGLSRRVLLFVEKSLLLFVLATVAYCTATVAHAKAKAAASIAISSSGGLGPNAPVSVETDDAKTGEAQVVGQLRIPALKISVPILSDYRTESLRDGIGHIPGTANAGGLGTMGLAGHRDTYFRPLKDIRSGMDIQVTNSSGTYHYLVDSTEVVQPDAVQVLDIRSRPELTLITCYPFYYVGAAPQRFIVHAHLLSALPD